VNDEEQREALSYARDPNVVRPNGGRAKTPWRWILTFPCLFVVVILCLPPVSSREPGEKPAPLFPAPMVVTLAVALGGIAGLPPVAGRYRFAVAVGLLVVAVGLNVVYHQLNIEL
jgi:hypothetical protein